MDDAVAAPLLQSYGAYMVCHICHRSQEPVPPLPHMQTLKDLFPAGSMLWDASGRFSPPVQEKVFHRVCG